MNLKAKQDIRRKLKVLRYANETGNVSRACSYYGISRESCCQWKRVSEAILHIPARQHFLPYDLPCNWGRSSGAKTELLTFKEKFCSSASDPISDL